MFTTNLVELIEALEVDFRFAVNIIQEGVGKAVTAGVMEAAEEARTKHTFTNRSGELEKSIKGIVIGWRGDTFFANIVADKSYASFVEEGTRDHIIEAKNRKALHFEWGGDFVFFRRVHHPGTRPQPFMGPAYIKAERVIIREIEIAVVRAQEWLSR